MDNERCHELNFFFLLFSLLPFADPLRLRGLYLSSSDIYISKSCCNLVGANSINSINRKRRRGGRALFFSNFQQGFLVSPFQPGCRIGFLSCVIDSAHLPAAGPRSCASPCDHARFKYARSRICTWLTARLIFFIFYFRRETICITYRRR